MGIFTSIFLSYFFINSDTITVINDGEKDADISFAIKSVRIFDDVYVASDLIETGDTVPVGAVRMTSAQLLTKIQNDYPFTLSITSSSGTVTAEHQGTLTITFTWPYESGDDETDTEYGTTAYDFYEDNPTTEAIELVIKLIVTQHNGT